MHVHTEHGLRAVAVLRAAGHISSPGHIPGWRSSRATPGEPSDKRDATPRSTVNLAYVVPVISLAAGREQGGDGDGIA